MFGGDEAFAKKTKFVFMSVTKKIGNQVARYMPYTVAAVNRWRRC